MKEFLSLFKKLWSYYPPKIKFYYIFYTLISILNVSIFILIPFLYGKIIDTIEIGNYTNEKVYIYILLTVFGYLSIRIMSLINVKVKEELNSIFNNKIYKSILSLNNKDYKEKESSYWISILKHDRKQISNYF